MTMNNPETILKNEPFYTGLETIGGISCTVGYIKEFRWGWMGTQLNTFIIVGTANGLVTKRVIEDFSKACFDYAIKNHKGWPRGLQSAIGSIAILQATEIADDAVAFCEKLSKKHWSAFEIPVLYNLDQQYPIRFKKNPLWGTIYFPFFAKTIDQLTGKIG